ncbi:MAG TPA: lysozyme inhibitor LprI family protein, partial [Acetobacteraceae bacterium]|nr:lysozyme inhibitor LprI family protein [Acetobacteraceae bacterium]
MAQSFDCAKAQEPVDRAICASPNLRLLDSELATAFAAALKRDAPNADAIRQAQRSWARNRATCLARAHPGGDAASSPEQCLATAYADRLAALAEPPAKPPVVAATPGSAANTPHEEAAAANAAMPPAALNATPSPAAPNATPSPAALNATPSPGPGTVAASPATTKQSPAGAPAAPTPAAAEFAVAQPATGLPAVPDAAGTLDRDRFPTAGETDVLLHVATPG